MNAIGAVASKVPKKKKKPLQPKVCLMLQYIQPRVYAHMMTFCCFMAYLASTLMTGLTSSLIKSLLSN